MEGGICDCGNVGVPRAMGPGGTRIGDPICDRCHAMDGSGSVQAEIVHALLAGPATVEQLHELAGVRDHRQLLRTLRILAERGRVRQVMTYDTGLPVGVWMLDNPERPRAAAA